MVTPYYRIRPPLNEIKGNCFFNGFPGAHSFMTIIKRNPNKSLLFFTVRCCIANHIHKKRRLIMTQKRSRSYACSFFLLFAVIASPHAADTPLAVRLKAISGAEKVKVVYAKVETPHAVDFPTESFWSDAYLMGIRSDAGAEETLQTTKANYQNPLITHDGDHIVFSNLTSVSSATTYIVDWTKNSTPRKIAAGMTACLWYDTATGKEFAICAKNCGLMASDGSVCRVNINDTADAAVVFKGKKAVTHWLRISSDGKAFSGCMGPYGSGSASLETDDENGNLLASSGGGCWPSMPYDKTLRFVKVTADHDRWQIMGPNDAAPIDLLDLHTLGTFSQLRMASYLPTMLLIVTNAVDADNGTGDIQIVKTDASLQHILDTATVTTGMNAHFADVWSSALSNGVKPRPSSRMMPALKNGPVEYYSISGRRIRQAADIRSVGLSGPRPSGIYIKTTGRGEYAKSWFVSIVK
jgi:hypothetical protein